MIRKQDPTYWSVDPQGTSSHWLRSLVWLAAVMWAAVSNSTTTLWGDEPPATPQQAAEVIDLSKFELIRPVAAEGMLNQRLAGFFYAAEGSVTEIAKAIQDRLSKLGWKPLEGGTVTEQYASETYQKSGFTLSMSVMPSGQPNQVNVSLNNHGNVDFTKLPLPGELESQYQSPVMSMLGSPWPVEETAEKISQALIGAGWTPYGAPIGSWQFKQNGVRLNVSVMAAPAQNNRTVVQVSSEQMSADIPVLEGAEGIQYSDSTRSVLFDHSSSPIDVFASLRTIFEQRGFEPTTDSPIKIDFREHLIFRNPGKDMIEISCHEVEGKTRTEVEFQDAVAVEALNRAVEAEAARRKAEMAKQAVKERIVLPIPAGAAIEETTESSVEFSLASGKALAALQPWVSTLEKQGWKTTVNVREKVAGDLELARGEIELHVSYVDPGFIPASISVSVFGKATIEFKP